MNNSQVSSICLENSVRSTNTDQTYDKMIIPYYSLYSDRIVIHPRPFNNCFGRKRSSISDVNLKKKKFTGQISKVQKSTIKKRITAWLESIDAKNRTKKNRYERNKHYPVFLTLTLSSTQIHSDQEIKKKLLDLFIKKLKSKYDITEYFWRAERQNNGNIHFHLIIDKYCSFEAVKHDWNVTQNVLGYIDRFEEKYKHKNPPSVNIKGVDNVENFINYVLKYAIKEEKNKPIEGRVFGMSDSLRKISVFQDIMDSQLESYLDKYLAADYFKVYSGDYFKVLTFQKEFYNSAFYNLLKKRSDSYYLKTYENIYNPIKKERKIIKEFKRELVENSVQMELFDTEIYLKIDKHY